MNIMPTSHLLKIVKGFIDSPAFKEDYKFGDESEWRRAWEKMRWLQLKEMEETIWASRSQ